MISFSTITIFNRVSFVLRVKFARISYRIETYGAQPNNYEFRGGSYDRMNLHTHPRLDDTGNANVR